MAHVAHNTGEQEHYTPPEFIEAARRVFGGEIDLDPASNDIAQSWVRAKRYYTKDTNGLAHEWSGKMWMNPPYARGLVDDFIIKAVASPVEYIILVNNTTETKSGQRLLGYSDAVCFPFKRIRFVKPNGERGKSPLQGQMIAYRGTNLSAFSLEFGRFGVVLERGLLG